MAAFAFRPLSDDDLEIILAAVGPHLNSADDSTNSISERSFYGKDSYEPTSISCPSGSLVRSSLQGLSSDEQSYISGRDNTTRTALISFLDRIDLEDFNAADFIGSNTSVRIGLAFSGGGYRAMLQGAGFLAAADNRTSNATESGHIGGLLQASTYIVGLSGGSWLVGTYAMNNFSSVQSILEASDVWNLTGSLVAAPPGYKSDAAYTHAVAAEVQEKADAGFDVSVTDYWGRLIAFQMFNYSNGGITLSWSDIVDSESFVTYEAPFPIVHAVSVTAGEDTTLNTTSTIEFNPYEMGSWDLDFASFAQLKYIGSDIFNGTPKSCVTGYDKSSFIIGTSSSLFTVSPLNNSFVQAEIFPQIIYNAIEEETPNNFSRNAALYPNPFTGVSENKYKDLSQLSLVDGGLDGQGLPLLALLQEERAVDVIFAVDSSADSDLNWPTGEALIATYERQFLEKSAAMPYVPDNNSFVNLGLTQQPTFFGCNRTNSTSDSSPLIVYLANHPFTYFSNSSTLQLAYDTSTIEGMVTNGYNMGTQGNGTIESEWSACVACAIIHREVERRGLAMTDQCQACMEKHCWDGTIDSSTPSELALAPDYAIGEGVFASEPFSASSSSTSILSRDLSSSAASPSSSATSSAVFGSASTITPAATTATASSSAALSSATSSTSGVCKQMMPGYMSRILCMTLATATVLVIYL